MPRQKIKFRFERLTKKYHNPKLRILKILESKNKYGLIFITVKASTKRFNRTKLILTLTPDCGEYLIQFLTKEIEKTKIDEIKDTIRQF